MYLYGASGHCKVIMDMITSSTNKIVEAVFDDNVEIKNVLDVAVLCFNDFDSSKIDELIISIGNNEIRKMLAEKINATYISIIDKSAIVSKYATIGSGTVVMPGAIVNASTIIGNHCIVNSGAVVEHDCLLNDYVHVSPNTSLAGNVTVGEGSHIGIGATVIQGIKIGKWVTIGAGAVIINDVPDGATMVGNPARILKK
jgi:acetyltransferase EpsM